MFSPSITLSCQAVVILLMSCIIVPECSYTTRMSVLAFSTITTRTTTTSLLSSAHRSKAATASLSKLGMSTEAPQYQASSVTSSSSSSKSRSSKSISNRNFKFVRKNGRNSSNTRKNGRQNPANDAAFLRKRTASLMRVTAHDHAPSSREEENGNGKSRSMKVDKKTFHFLMDAWAFSGEPDASDQALRLLRRMEEMMDDPSHPLYYREIFPDVRSYTKVINAISRSANSYNNNDGVDSAPELAESLLNKMNEMVATRGYNAVKPNSFTYTAVIEAYANSGEPGGASARRAEELCQIMVSKYNDGDLGVQPTARAFNAVLNAYAKSGEPDAAERAEALFDKMEALYYDKSIASMKPDTYSFNNLITAWANHCVHEQRQHQQYDYYNNNDELDYYNNNQQDSYDNENGDVPSVGNNYQSMGAMNAKAVLERMEYLYSVKGDNDAKPTTVSYNAVLDAYAKSGDEDAAEKAEQLLRSMEKMYSEYESSKESGNDNSDDSNSRVNDAVKPNVRSFNTVINVWAKSKHINAPNRAQDLLDFMKELSEKYGNKHVRPDVHSFCTVINAWAKSSARGKADRSLNLYKEMKTLYENGKNTNLRPNVVAVNAVMNACAFTNSGSNNNYVVDMKEQSRAMEIAHTILKELESNPKYGKPDQVTYGTFLKVCANQMPDTSTRQKIVEMIFKKCCKSGQVGNLVLNQLQDLCSDEVYQELTGGRRIDEKIKMQDMPQKWWCNVVEGKYRRRNRKF